jgi:glycosyltransferase involved in cell wall biosynthesis
MKRLKFSILMPVYNGESVIRDAIESVFRQNYPNFEIIISDDGSEDNTRQVVRSIKDKRIKYFRSKKNLGYGPNLEICRRLVSKDSKVIFLMAVDDLICKNNFNKINRVFNEYPEVGAIIRPFYMFTDDINRPIRDFEPFDRKKDTIISISDNKEELASIFRTICQLSGLAFRANLTEVPFHPDVMTSHIYPFLDIFKKHKIMYLKNYTIAVRTLTSQTRTLSEIYEISPVQSWIDLINKSFKGKEFEKVRKICLEIILKQHYVGLIQLKNFSTMKNLIREYEILVKNDWFYIFHPRFWLYVAITFFTPRFILRPAIDFYKDKILSKLIQNRKLRFVKA